MQAINKAQPRASLATSHAGHGRSHMLTFLQICLHVVVGLLCHDGQNKMCKLQSAEQWKSCQKGMFGLYWLILGGLFCAAQ